MLRCQIRFCEPQGRCCHGPCTAAPAPRISAGGLPFFLVPGKYVEMPWHCHPTIPSRPTAQHKIPLTKPWTDPMLNITKPGFLMDSLQHPKMKPATRPSLPCVWRSRVGSIEASKSSMRFRKSPSSCCEIGRAVTSWGLEGWQKKTVRVTYVLRTMVGKCRKTLVEAFCSCCAHVESDVDNQRERRQSLYKHPSSNCLNTLQWIYKRWWRNPNTERKITIIIMLKEYVQYPAIIQQREKTPLNCRSSALPPWFNIPPGDKISEARDERGRTRTELLLQTCSIIIHHPSSIIHHQ